ncbi:hypothetical protein FQA39_LY15143 [Lamprigera yunnana]|nr:hypothetical protein FQA39_LY15143 [Lamprigera yunnana]
MEHNHAAQAARPDALRVKQFLTERAFATQDNQQQIMAQAVEAILPSKETIKQNIRKRRNKYGAFPIPEKVGNLMLSQFAIYTKKLFVSSFEDDDLGYEKFGGEKSCERKWLSTKGPEHQTTGRRNVRERKGRRRNKHARADALIKITDDIKPNTPEIAIEDAKKKLNNLRSQFAHENNKVIASRKSGIGTDDIYEPTIWWYEKLLFLLPYVKVRKGKSNFDESSQQQELDQEAATSSDTSEIIPVTPKVTKRRKVEMEDSDPVMDKPIATLHNLDKTIQNSTICASPKTDSNIFAEYVDQELQVIDNLELLNDAKHEINNVLYNYKKNI